MNYTAVLTELFNRIPRRHSSDNLKEIQLIIADYEAALIAIEAISPWYEQHTPPFFETLETVRAGVKKSTDNKASKKNKDLFFDEAASALKDSMQELMDVYATGLE